MIRSRLALMSAAAVAMSVQPLPALAQPRCITEAEVSAMVVYGVPIALEALGNACAGQLSARGFLATGAGDLSARYAREAETAWPQAFEALMVFAERGTAGSAGASGTNAGADLGFLRQLPPEALRPLVDEIVAMQIAGALRPEQCPQIERLVAALAPLEPGEAGRLVAVIAGMAGVADPQICPVQ